MITNDCPALKHVLLPACLTQGHCTLINLTGAKP
jgi:hypothetical protein